jgi:hypothetical protein
VIGCLEQALGKALAYDKTAGSSFERPQAGPEEVSGKDVANHRKRIQGDVLG